ncbi:MAG TPA: twin-arginine translocase subunit TatC [Candidatus Krumholzibacteria bacterium]|nr:twin-arginine translocase subunit TatC [Candidatus Krumholzibacteria bacterium]HPD71263.1 twin-arginine translocase subunit TatC [Candidatus Krumholzibacteria bacterium]HRY39037.1 twin-arginine translocase subunit TatC [Candidatus Krumholzibacteria bacterium]
MTDPRQSADPRGSVARGEAPSLPPDGEPQQPAADPDHRAAQSAAESAAEGAAGDDAGEDTGMSFLDHLEELRRVLIHSVLAATAAAILCWFWSGDLLDLLVQPVRDQGVYFTKPNEAFMIRLKLAGACGLFIVLPFILWKVYGFILPGLYRRERKIITPLVIASTLLFYLGVVFSFLVVCPLVVRFLMSFGTAIMHPLLGIGPYFSFVSQLSLAFGLIFELPVLVFFLSMIGIVDPRWLLRTWRYAIVVIAVASAILTPPDAISQLAMAIPVTLLYMSSVMVAIVATRRRRTKALDRSDRSA